MLAVHISAETTRDADGGQPAFLCQAAMQMTVRKELGCNEVDSGEFLLVMTNQTEYLPVAFFSQ